MKTLPLLAAAGSLALLLGAFGFQYLGGLAPCALCIWQRWPHAVAVVAGGLAQISPIGALVGLVSALAGSGLGLYHTGVERQWWDGPATCSAGGDISNLTPEELLNQILEAPIVRCTDVAWEMFGLSMASWNGLLSLGLAGVWALALLRRRSSAP